MEEKNENKPKRQNIMEKPKKSLSPIVQENRNGLWKQKQEAELKKLKHKIVNPGQRLLLR